MLTLDRFQSLKPFFINVSYHILVASLTLMALFLNRAIRVRLATSMIWHIDEQLFKGLEPVYADLIIHKTL